MIELKSCWMSQWLKMRTRRSLDLNVAPLDSQAEGEPGQVEQVPAEGDPDVALRKVAGIAIGVVLTAFSCLCGGINFDNIRLSDSPFLMAGGVILMLILLGLVLWKLKVIVSMSMDSDRFL